MREDLLSLQNEMRAEQQTIKKSNSDLLTKVTGFITSQQVDREIMNKVNPLS